LKRTDHTDDNLDAPDLSACAVEPIHIPGSIQPGGCLIAMTGDERIVVSVSGNTADYLNIQPREILGCQIATVLGPEFRIDLDLALVAYAALTDQTHSFVWTPPGNYPALACFVHQHAGRIFAEFEPLLADQKAGPVWLYEAMEAFQRVHNEPHLIAKLQIAADVIRTYTDYDRVMIYRFDRDWNGEVVAEALAPELEPYLGLCYPAADIPVQARALYLISRVRIITDVAYKPVPLMGLGDEARELDLSRCFLRSVSPVHLEYLQNMGVQATMVCSLVLDGKLWGLISCHHHAPKPPDMFLRKLCGFLSRDLALQINLCVSQRTQTLVSYLSTCRDSVIAGVRSGQHFSTLLKSDLGRDILDLVQADGVGLIMGGELMCHGVTPPIAVIHKILNAVRSDLLEHNQSLFHSEKLSAQLPWTEAYALQAAGVMVMFLPASSGAALIWFRGERSRTITWGGNPDKSVDVMADGRIHPRKSFQAWKQEVRARSLPWLPEELASAEALQRLLLAVHAELAEQELRLLRQSVAQISDVVLITEAEPFNKPGPRIVFVNEPFTRNTGYSAEEVLGKTPRLLQGPETERAELDRLRTALERWESVRCELTNYRKDGTPFFIELDVSPVSDESGWFTHWVSIQRDITDRKRVESNLLRSEEQFKQLVCQLTEGVLVIDSEGYLRSHNQSAADILKLGSDVADGHVLVTQALQLWYPNGMQVPPAEHPALLATALQGEFRNREYQIEDDNGMPRWISLNTRVMEAVGRNLHQGVLLSFRDVTEQFALRAKLSRLAVTDPLTGLPNRTQFSDRLGVMLGMATRESAAVDVILIDLDNFKDVNDSFGHGTGDQLLCQVAERFQSIVGPDELVARLGGDEFVACGIVPLSELGMHGLAFKLREALTKPFVVEGIELQVVGSIGMACYPADGSVAGELLRKADIAMYAAKGERDQNLRAYTDEMELSVQNHMTARLRLQRALDFEQFELHYQPKVSVLTGEILGFEALLRWRDEEDRLIMPGEFISLAENTGMIHPIGEWILKQAVHDLGVLSDAGLGHLTVAVNISAVQFKRPELVSGIKLLLEQACVGAGRLEVEITESVLISDDLTTNMSHLEQFAEAGVSVFIDDFGTGYSSLSYLRRFQVHALKIDRSFIHGAAEDAGQGQLVKTIINLAHGLDLHTVAEGVETQAELDLVKECGCQVYQGFFFSAAAPLGFFLKGGKGHQTMGVSPPADIARLN